MARRTLLRRLHLIAGMVAFGTILAFWISTVSVELVGSAETVTTVKRTIPWGLLILVPALATTGASGYVMAGRSTEPRIVAKLRRMIVIAAIGLVVLVPSALYLAGAGHSSNVGWQYDAVQAVELIAGATNLALMSLNIRDGLRLTGRRFAGRTRESLDEAV